MRAHRQMWLRDKSLTDQQAIVDLICNAIHYDYIRSTYFGGRPNAPQSWLGLCSMPDRSLSHQVAHIPVHACQARRKVAAMISAPSSGVR